MTENYLAIQKPALFTAAHTRRTNRALPTRQGPVCVALITEDDDLQSAVCIAVQPVGLQPRRFLTPWQFEQTSMTETPSILLLDQQQKIDCEDPFTARCLQQSEKTRLILLSESPVTRDVVAAMKAGACTVVDKPVNVETLREAIIDAGRPQDHLGAMPPFPDSGNLSGKLLTLTLQQQRVAQLIYLGKSNRQIADQLSISVKTVESHRNQIMNRLKVRSVAALIRLMIHDNDAIGVFRKP